MSEGWLRHLSWPRKRQNTEFMGEMEFWYGKSDWCAGVHCKDGRRYKVIGCETRAEAARKLLEMVENGPA